jgi:flavin-dependent dehydrogenase
LIRKHYDLLILGTGPAASSAAIFAAEAGMSVCLIDKPASLYKRQVGESLSIAAKPVLQDLTLWDNFAEDGHLPCYAHASAWGSEQLDFHDSLNDLRATGQPLSWHLDRQRFDQRLSEKRQQCVINEIIARQYHAQREDTLWTVEAILDNLREIRITAPWIIDATGRTAAFARKHGARRLQFDKQLALVQVMQADTHEQADYGSLVETLAEGWCYSAPMPANINQQRLISILFCQPGGKWKDKQCSMQQWRRDSLQNTTFTQRRLENYQANGEVLSYVSGSACLDRFSGEGWLAIGDAALSFDPLSAHGMTVALASGRDAIKLLQSTDLQALALWQQQLEQAFNDYWQLLKHYYTSESRWPDSDYWQGRWNNLQHNLAT